MDVNFSNAALHWVIDHRKTFQNFLEMLKSMNDSSDNVVGQLLIWCGGDGTLQQTITFLERITHLDSFKAYFADWKQPLYSTSLTILISC